MGCGDGYGFVRDSLVTLFSNVVSFNGIIYAIDYKGNLHAVDYKLIKVIKTVAVDLSGGLPDSIRSKLMQRNGDLLLVTWRPSSPSPCFSTEYPLYFKLHDRIPKKWVMFVSLDWCFSVCNQDLNISYDIPVRRKEISTHLMSPGDVEPVNEAQYYSSPAWDVYKENYYVYFDSSVMRKNTNCYQLFEGASVEHSIACAFIRSEHQDRTDYLCRTIAAALWPPPTWFLPDAFTCSRDEENDDLNLSSHDVSTNRKVVLPTCLAAGSSRAVIINEEDRPVLSDRVTADSVAIGDSDALALGVQYLYTCTSTTMFKGVKIKSNLVPTLQNIWLKHGNILEECGMRNGDLIAKALESLANSNGSCYSSE